MSAAGASRPPARLGGGGGTEGMAAAAERKGERAAVALRSHSEAERRRRERINAHLATLRQMVPGTDKLDKAALLAEVIRHVKELKGHADQISARCAVPSAADEVLVEAEPAAATGLFFIRASLSCGDDCAGGLFADVKRALQRLGLELFGAEVTAVGGRVKLAFVMRCEGAMDSACATASVHAAFAAVLERANSAAEFMPRSAMAASALLSKRRRVSPFESSSSSS